MTDQTEKTIETLRGIIKEQTKEIDELTAENNRLKNANTNLQARIETIVPTPDHDCWGDMKFYTTEDNKRIAVCKVCEKMVSNDYQASLQLA